MKRLPDGKRLLPGRFYRAWDHELWCCFKVTGSAKPHCQAACVRVSDSRVEDFYIDGRYDEAGKREHCLIEDISAFWERLQPNYDKQGK
jgi:hypothetical protein